MTERSKSQWQKGDRQVLQARFVWRHVDGSEEEGGCMGYPGGLRTSAAELEHYAQMAGYVAADLEQARCLLELLRTASRGRKTLPTEQIEAVLEEVLSEDMGLLFQSEGVADFLETMEKLFAHAEALPVPPQAQAHTGDRRLTLT